MELSNLKSVKINQINCIISEKRQSVKTEYDLLMERIKVLQKQMDDYTILQSNIDEILKIVNMPMKIISLLELVSENNTITDLLSQKMENLTLQEVVGDVDIEIWIHNKLKIIKKDINSSNLLQCYQNQTAIKNLKIYDATLKAMYPRRRTSDVYKVAMDYLVSNSIVEKSFSINDLKKDFRNYSDMKTRFDDVLR